MESKPTTIEQHDGSVLTQLWYRPETSRFRLSMSVEQPYVATKYLNLELNRETATKLRDALNEFLG